MEFPAHLESVPGANQLFEWFGYWPSFHDAEVLNLHLDRSGKSFVTIHTWQITDTVDSNGYYVLAKHVVAEFSLFDVFNLDLNGFSGQNVLFGLMIQKVDGGFRMVLDDSFGIGGTIDAKSITLRLIPGEPQCS